MDVAEVQSKLAEPLARLPPEIIAVWLFGSVARGRAGRNSDVDLAFLYSETPPHTLLDRPYLIADDLRGVLGCDVQVVVANDASPDLMHRVRRDGILLLDRDRSKRIRHEVKSRNEYFDMQPIWRRYREAAAKRAKP